MFVMVELSRTVRHFEPQWFAIPMGIGAFTITSKISAQILSSEILHSLALALTGLTVFLTAGFAFPWFLRLIKYFEEVKADLSHPVRSQFFPTMPISLILVGITVQRTLSMYSPEIVEWVSSMLFLTGSAGIFISGIVLTKILFTNTNIGTEHGVFAWFIPPVSHIIIPALGFMLLSSGLSGPIAEAVYIISLTGLGVGTFMFLFLTPIILYRYAYEDLPDSKLAPTFIIGLAPTSVLIINAEYLIKTIQSGFLNYDTVIINILELATGIMWGFSSWWLILTAAIIIHYIRNIEHPLDFTWWAYTFPLGAFTISTWVTSQAYNLQVLEPLIILLTAILASIIILNTAYTVKIIRNGKAFPLE